MLTTSPLDSEVWASGSTDEPEMSDLRQLVETRKIRRDDVDIIGELMHLGAASIDELAIGLDRGSENLGNRMSYLQRVGLIRTREVRRGSRTFEIYVPTPVAQYCYPWLMLHTK